MCRWEYQGPWLARRHERHFPDSHYRPRSRTSRGPHPAGSEAAPSLESRSNWSPVPPRPAYDFGSQSLSRFRQYRHCGRRARKGSLASNQNPARLRSGLLAERRARDLPWSGWLMCRPEFRPPPCWHKLPSAVRLKRGEWRRIRLLSGIATRGAQASRHSRQTHRAGSQAMSRITAVLRKSCAVSPRRKL